MNWQLIFKLIKKDFIVYRNFILGLSAFNLLVGMLTIFINTNRSSIFISSIGGVMSMVVIASFILETQKGKIWVHNMSLPIRRKDFFVARFLNALLISLINFLIWVAAYTILLNMISPGSEHVLTPQIILYAWMNLLLQLGLFFFVFYRFKIVVIMIVFIFPTILIGLLVPKGKTVAMILMEKPIFFISWCLISLGVYILSYFINLAYFNKKAL